MADFIVTKRLITSSDIGFDASDIETNQSGYMVDDIFDGGNDVDVSCKDLDAATGTIVTLDSTLATSITQVSTTSNITTLNVSTLADISGFLRLTPQSATISGGAITATRSSLIVSGEDGVADDLDNIYGGAEGNIIIVRPYSDTVTITIRHNRGNILCGSDISLDNLSTLAIFMYDAVQTRWLCLASKANVA